MPANTIQPVIAELEDLIASNPNLAGKLNRIKDQIQEMVQAMVGIYSAELNVIRSAAEIDDLTQLGNRRGWESIIKHHVNDSDVAIVFLDLNGLKIVNDTQGHEAGDRMIKRASDCIRASIRPTDYAARIGGDEFVILYTNYPGSAETLQNSICRVKHNFEGADIKVSVGGALRHEGTTLHDVIALADARMYEEKRSRR